MTIAIVGGGAAGFFAAITAVEHNPDCQVTIFERGKTVLEKVRISGGGRCNVTHACFDARTLTQHYPRGSRELLGPFSQFGPEQTIEWFARRGVTLKTEADGRMFPSSDNSDTIVQCLLRSAQQGGVKVLTGMRVENIEAAPGGGWQLYCTGESIPRTYDRLMIASGSNTHVWNLLEKSGHPIVSPVPSLFTFNCRDTRLRDLSGVSVPLAAIQIPELKLKATGPLLITHWGLSGPGILRLSAWGARLLYDLNYKFVLTINWTGERSKMEIQKELNSLKINRARKAVSGTTALGLPSRLWRHLCEAADINDPHRWADLNARQMTALEEQIADGQFQITGKSAFKEEFVTAGGVDLKALHFKTFESRISPGLFIAGEALNIDAITGGFNFQAAWTGGWLAGRAMATPNLR